MPTEPRLRILVAEVQSRCGSLFVAGDATPHEEAMTRQSARLMLRLAETLRTSATRDRLLRSLADASAAESPENWAARAGLLWCAEPEVTAARVLWKENPSEDHRDDATGMPGESTSPEAARTRTGGRPPSIVPLGSRGRTLAEIHLWCDGIQGSLQQRLEGTPVLSAWTAWASIVADRSLLERRLQGLVSAVRQHADEEQVRVRDGKLSALAEFAAGAGHELNNPLAVIVGRAQLLLGRTARPGDQPIAAHHPQPGPAHAQDSPRPDVRGQTPCAAAAGLPPLGDPPRLPSRASRRNVNRGEFD